MTREVRGTNAPGYVQYAHLESSASTVVPAANAIR